jgi:hypothetical protein
VCSLARQARLKFNNNYGGGQLNTLISTIRKKIQSVTGKAGKSALLIASLFALSSSPAQAFEFKVGDWDAYIDTTFSASVAMRVEGNDDFGTSHPTGSKRIFKDPGDIYATPLGLLSDMGISKGNFGAFARWAYVYDPTIMGKDCTNCIRPNNPPYTPGAVPWTHYDVFPVTSAFQDGAGPNAEFAIIDGIDSKAQNLAGNRFNLLDLFVYGGWDIGTHPLNVRVGKQVINWGESGIQGGGISQMQNPRDLSKATTPGTDVKETLIPQESFYFNFGFTDNITLEAYYTWNWRESTFVGVGTYFSGFDFIGPGYNPDLFVRGLVKGENHEPDNGGQWGINMHFVIPQLNYADLGIYWVRSHAFIPYTKLSETYVPVADPANPGRDTLGAYTWTYGQDQDTYAISLNGEGPWDTSFGLELNLKKNSGDVRECRDLFGISDVVPYGFEVDGPYHPGAGVLPIDITAGMAFDFPPGTRPTTGPGAGGDIDCNPTTSPGLRDSGTGASDVYVLLGQLVKSGGTDFMGASKLSLIMDVSMVWVPDCHGGDEMDRINNKPTESTSAPNGSMNDRGHFDCVAPLDQPITDFSWGYTAVAALEYPNAFANITVKPTFIFVHNVEGYSPASQGGGMREEQRTAIAKITFDYQGQQSLDVQYVTWLGTAGGSSDKDFVSLVYKYSF